MAENFQRIGSISNAHVGRDFESAAMEALAGQGITVQENYAVEVGVGEKKKKHAFDLGSEFPPVLVECKSHCWTSGSNVPSAKLTVWNEAMYYFHCAPSHYRKILFVLHDTRPSNNESLASYYIRSYRHLIPNDVEIWELRLESDTCELVYSHGKPSDTSTPMLVNMTKPVERALKDLTMQPETATADEIRAFVSRTLVNPARASKKTSIKVVAGDVHKDMGLQNRMPAVCSALDAQKFQDQFNILISRRDGPRQGPTATWIFAI